MKPLNYKPREGSAMFYFSKEKLTKLAWLIDVIIEENSARYTHGLCLLNERFKNHPPVIGSVDIDELLDAMIETTHELTNIIKNSNHANYFLDQYQMNLYAAFQLVATIERELNRFEGRRR